MNTPPTLPSTKSSSSGDDESGWTAYLDQASNSTDPYYKRPQGEMGSAQVNCIDQEDDEDLSMVSDATSGPPPNFAANYNTMDTMYYRCPSFGSAEDQKSKQKSSKRKEAKEAKKCLDDTASSPNVFHNSSQGNKGPYEDHESRLLSADAHVQGEFGPENNLGFLQPAVPVIRGKPGCSLGRKR